MRIDPDPIIKIFTKKVVWLLVAIVYCLLIIVITPESLSSKNQIVFYGYGFFIFACMYYVLQTHEKDVQVSSREETIKKFFICLLIFSFALLLITRLLPFVHYGATPLGYDTGLYVKNMSTTESLEVTKKAFYLIIDSLIVFGMTPTLALHFIVVLTQILIAGAFYVLFRSITSPSRFGFAVTAVFLFVSSQTQFLAFWWMFAGQMFSASLFLITFALLFRWPILAILTAAAGMLIHSLPFIGFAVAIVVFAVFFLCKTFLWEKASYRIALLSSVLGLSLFGNIIYWNWQIVSVFLFQQIVKLDILFKKDISILYPLLVAIFLVLILLVIGFFARRRFETKSVEKTIFYYSLLLLCAFIVVVLLRWGLVSDQLRYFFRHYGLASNYTIPWGIPAVKGLFIDFVQFRNLTFFILPFFLFGLICPFVWRSKLANRQYPNKFLAISYIMLVILFLLSYFPFIRQHRFIIMLDLMIIMFSVPAIYYLIMHFTKDRLGKLLLLIFIIVFAHRIMITAWTQPPQIYSEELQELKALATIAESNAQVMTTNTRYTPWAIGYSERKAFGPGWEFDQWSLYKWMEFWHANGDSADLKRLELLEDYNEPLYIFVGSSEGRGNPYYKLFESNSVFEKISAHIWKYEKPLVNK
ncbi:MAG: hypothetical protein AAB575_05125 [Patescibacteria group bacterium]